MVIDQKVHRILNQTGDEWEREAGNGVAVQKEDSEVKPPPLYKVIILNDDYTPMEFVVDVLEQFFSMSNEMATRVMLQVHTEGRGICGLYPKDIAETKASQVNEHARLSGHPLLCKVECQD